MIDSDGVTVPDAAADERRQKSLTMGLLIFSGLVLVCLLTYFINRSLKAKPPDAPAPPPAAELVSGHGMVLVQNPGRAEWRQINAGARFVAGDRVRTDSSGGAIIRYITGTTVSISRNTVFTVREPGDNQIEISASPTAAGVPPLLLAAEDGIVPGGRKGPFVELYQIIPFGKSLELVGRIEAGTSLVVNDEIVEVSGDGSFKHFTSPFPAAADKVRLNLKVMDLAGRTRVWTAIHDFSPNGGEN